MRWTSPARTVRGQLETEPTPVMMTDYWPTVAMALLYRRPNPSVYLHVIDPGEPNATQMPSKAGSIHSCIHQYQQRPDEPIVRGSCH
ncbi:MAG: hypothetical protein AUK47_20915 [Deltaproteobacteria bacterium CG2_30_63_29]|nr:MAG: hypothetical protein AUK47_20915 [Deltaproteobacteria bacterium CG2_30_63_29]